MKNKSKNQRNKKKKDAEKNKTKGPAQMVSTKTYIMSDLKPKKQKKQKNKTILLNPYEPVSWPQIDSDTQTEILEKIKGHMVQLNLDKQPEIPPFLPKDERLKKRNDFHQKFPDIVKIKKQLVFGINVVMKQLEHDNLRAVIVCRSSPTNMSKLLIPLLATRGCPVVCLHSFSKTIGPLLKFNTLVAVGIKKREETDHDGLDLIVDLVKQHHKTVEFMGLEAVTIATDDDVTIATDDDDVTMATEDLDEERDETMDGEDENVTEDMTIEDPKTKDYSYLYIMRDKSETKHVFKQDFIGFSNNPDLESDLSDSDYNKDNDILVDGVLGVTDDKPVPRKTGFMPTLVDRRIPNQGQKTGKSGPPGGAHSQNKGGYRPPVIQKQVPRPDKVRNKRTKRKFVPQKKK